MTTNKKIQIWAMTALLSFLFFASMAQWTPGRYMRQAMNNTLAKSQYMTSNSTTLGYKDGLCFLGAYLSKSGEVGWTLTLNAGTEYAFVGGGDNDATDVDLRITNSYSTTLSQDNQTDITPLVRFTPSYTGRYTIYMKLYSSTSKGSFCAMAIMRNGGFNIPTNRLDESIDNIIQMGNNLNDRKSTNFISNQWSLFGGLFSSGESQNITNLDLGNTNCVILGSGDRNVSDADLHLTAYGVDEKDSKTDARPVVFHTSSSYKKHELEIKNYSSSGKSVVISAILNI
jgi:hypothetical protein